MTRARSHASRGQRAEARAGPRTLAIDVDGTGLKAAILDAEGRLVSDRVRVPTPARCPPTVLIRAVAELIAPLGRRVRVVENTAGLLGGVACGVEPRPIPHRRRTLELPPVTASGMREIDRIAIEETGPHLFQMMENAGRNLALQAIEILGPDWRERHVLGR